MLGHINDWGVTIHLMESMAVPALIDFIEALNLNKTEIKSLNFTLKRALFKISRVNPDNLAFCMKFFGISTIDERLEIKRRNFH